MNTLLAEYETLNNDAQIWEEFFSRISGVDLVSVPIMHRGVVIGGLGFATEKVNDWNPAQLGTLRSCASALSLWLTQETNRIHVITSPLSGTVTRLAVTERQLMILDLVDKGKSNACIARTLGFSESTIKNDLHRAMRSLNATNRVDLVRKAQSFDLLPPPHVIGVSGRKSVGSSGTLAG